jgi:putative phosphoesterase
MIAALYDIHGNLPALEAVLQEVRNSGVSRIIVGGDVCPGPMAVECLELLLAQELPVDFIQGNGDRETLAVRRGEPTSFPEAFRETVAWCAAQLPAAQEASMRGWPSTTRVQLPDGKRVLFCHATPRNDTDIFTRVTPDAQLRALFEGLDVDLVVCGHTHMQFDRAIGSVRVVNAGSVGMPFGDPGAHWLLLDTDAHLRRTPYDHRAAAERIRASGYPMREQFAADNILTQPGEEQMIEVFERSSVSV